jgi:hypothetical protein
VFGIDQADYGTRPIGTEYITPVSLRPSQSISRPFPIEIPETKKSVFGSENEEYSRYHNKKNTRELAGTKAGMTASGYNQKEKKDKAKSGSRGVSIASLE